MKRIGFLQIWFGFVFIVSTACAGPLDNWHWRNPLPSGNPQSGPHQMNAIVFANGKFVAVGAVGGVSISTDVTNWTESATATTNDLNGLVYASGQFVAVGNNGVVETSTDGANWNLANSGTTTNLKAVAYGNGKFVAVGGAVIASPNAVNWTGAASGLNSAVAVAGGSNGFIAVTGSSQVYYSSDGLVWTSQTFTVPDSGNPFFNGPPINRLAVFWNGTFYVGSFQYPSSMSADMFIFSSTDGNTWSTNKIGNVFTGTHGFTYNFFMAGSNNLVAAGTFNSSPFLQFSTDGLNWLQTNYIPPVRNYQGPIAGAYGNGNYVVVSGINVGASLPSIFTSADGVSWTDREQAPTPPSGPTNTFTGIANNNGVNAVISANLVALSSNGLSYFIASNTPALSAIATFSNKFVGVGSSGAIYVSGDGLSWTQRNSGTASSLHGITSGNGLLVAVGDNGAIQTSPTSTIWTSRASGTSLPLYSVTWSSGIFVAVGQLGTVVTSPNGSNWTVQDSGQLTNLFSVVYGSAGFLAVGPGGTMLTSPDGATWTQQNPGTSANLENVSFGNGYYLAVGDNATAMTSTNGVNWTPRNLGATGGQNFYGSAFLNNRFVVVGASGTVLESDTIAPLLDLQIHRDVAQGSLTMFATPGINFRLQACTNLSAAWSDVATFSNAAAITWWTNNSGGNAVRFFRLISP